MVDQLGPLDSAFLGLETRRQNANLGNIVVVDPSTLDAPFDREHLKALMASRLGRIKLFRKRLRHVPLGLDRPYWVDDVDFDLDYHVRGAALPSPGGTAELLELVARIHERPFDFTRPLWEIYAITGLADGTAAVYAKTHHSLIDGLSGVELLAALVDLEPGHLPGEADDFQPRRGPSALGMLGRAAKGVLSRPADAVRLVESATRYLPAVAFQAAPTLNRLAGRPRPIDAATPLAVPRTPFNVPISAHRRIGLCQLPLDEVKQVKNAYGVSVNDVVLGVTAGAVRRWLEQHGAATSAPLVTMVPVGLAGDRAGGAGNHVTAMFTPLPVHVEDPVARLDAAHAATAAAKSHGAAVPADLLASAIEFAPPVLLGRGMRAVFELGLFRGYRAFNTVVSNIPGPDLTAYIAGAEILAIYPISIVVDGMGLNVTIQGFRNQLNVGVIACREAIPDADRLAEWIREELDVLLDGLPG